MRMQALLSQVLLWACLKGLPLQRSDGWFSQHCPCPSVPLSSERFQRRTHGAMPSDASLSSYASILLLAGVSNAVRASVLTHGRAGLVQGFSLNAFNIFRNASSRDIQSVFLTFQVQKRRFYGGLKFGGFKKNVYLCKTGNREYY